MTVTQSSLALNTVGAGPRHTRANAINMYFVGLTQGTVFGLLAFRSVCGLVDSSLILLA